MLLRELSGAARFRKRPLRSHSRGQRLSLGTPLCSSTSMREVSIPLVYAGAIDAVRLVLGDGPSWR